VSIVPWQDPQLPVVGSYQRALEILSIPHSKLIVDLVVLVAVASCLNSALYTASRMLFSLSRRGDAPAAFGRTAAGGVPRAAVLASTAIGFLTTIANYVMPEAVFSFLLATSGAVALLVYLVIAVSQLRMRRKLEARGDPLDCRMWLFPWLTWLVIGFIIAALGIMLMSEAHRMEILATGLLALIVVAIGTWVGTRNRSESTVMAAPAGR
jgi:GABA permease